MVVVQGRPDPKAWAVFPDLLFMALSNRDLDVRNDVTYTGTISRDYSDKYFVVGEYTQYTHLP